MNTESYIKELSQVMIKVTKAAGRVLEQDHMRFMAMYVGAGSGIAGGCDRHQESIMEHRVIQNLKAVSGDRSLVRQWHRMFRTTLG